MSELSPKTGRPKKPRALGSGIGGSLDRIRAAIIVDPGTGCWLWTRELNNNGYAYVRQPGTGRKLLVHRLLYLILVGSIPDGHELDHFRCEQPCCVRPDHVEPVTHRENMARSKRARRTHCIRGHAYTPENTGRPTRGGRYCRRCERERMRAKGRRIAA